MAQKPKARAAARPPRAAKSKPSPSTALAVQIVYSAELAERICEALASGDLLTNICEAPDMPTRKTVYQWLKRHREFNDAYLIARRWWADAQLERCIEIAADGSNDLRTDGQGNKVVNQDVIARSRLLVETLKWAMSKSDPARFGDRVAVEVEDKPLNRDEMMAQIIGILRPSQAALPAPDGDASTRH